MELNLLLNFIYSESLTELHTDFTITKTILYTNIMKNSSNHNFKIPLVSGLLVL